MKDPFSNINNGLQMDPLLLEEEEPCINWSVQEKYPVLWHTRTHTHTRGKKKCFMVVVAVSVHASRWSVLSANRPQNTLKEVTE